LQNVFVNRRTLIQILIKLNSGIFIITGGAIKLTATMQERSHTALELTKIEKVRRFLIDIGIVDETGFEDYIKEI
jgi:hypothetical protein